MREFSADMTAPQSAKLCKDFSAKRAAPEPPERRAITGFYKRTIFCLTPLNGCLSSSEDRLILCYSFYEISRYLIRSEKMCDERLFKVYSFLWS